MRNMVRWMALGLLIALLVYLGGVVMDKRELRNKVIRIHVVGASDSESDQARKLQVRDAVLERLGGELSGVADKQQALETIRRLREELTVLSDAVLARAGSEDRVTVSVGDVTFPHRDYDTFSLPAGVYDALKITIGEGKGQNWWCVVFPELCIPAATDQMDAVAADAGFSRGTRGAMTGKYEVRSYLLELLGRVENFFHGRQMRTVFWTDAVIK